jgi:uncharacterized radical SAM superfamily Fe-S cluster-containing enzyme
MKIYPNVPIVYKNKFPKNYINQVAWWGSFDREKLQINKGKILSLDIDFGVRCSLNCPHCFRRNSNVDKLEKTMMNYQETLNIVKEAKKLGLETIKFLGAGEPFENEEFLNFLTDLKKLGIHSSIFTKGHVLGDDGLAKKYFGHQGALLNNSCKQIVSTLCLQNLSNNITLGHTKFGHLI